MNIDRTQGLIDWYPTKNRNAILTMANYWLSQGVMASDDVAAVIAGMDAYDATQEKIDLREIIEGISAQKNEEIEEQIL